MGPIPIGLGGAADLFCAANAAEGASPRTVERRTATDWLIERHDHPWANLPRVRRTCERRALVPFSE
ncbi:MAG: hypothetical protein M3082_06245 [Candidatus Dormibacteraeota bacterium]|nr:hypothetical protein [Candidatus Dormibacteraeota bacterium]